MSESSDRPKRKIIVDKPLSNNPTVAASDPRKPIKTDTLVVVSKVKKLIKDQAGYSTSQCGIDALTEKVVAECMKAIDKAREAGRKTVMGRDIVD